MATNTTPQQRILSKKAVFVIKHAAVANSAVGKFSIYNEANRSFVHRWSPKSIGMTYGFRKYDNFIALKDYLELPVAHAEDILEGVAMGMKERAKADAKAAEKQGKKGSDGYQTEADKALAQIGRDNIKKGI